MKRSNIIIKLNQSNLEDRLKEIRKIHLNKFPFSTTLPNKYTYLANKLFNTVSSTLQCNLILFEIKDNYGGIPLWLCPSVITLKLRDKKIYKFYTPNKEIYERFHRRLNELQRRANAVTLDLKLSSQYESILRS